MHVSSWQHDAKPQAECQIKLTRSVQAALSETWLLYDIGVLASMLTCLITYSVYIQSLVDFQPLDTYEVYDSLGAAQARLLLPKKAESAYNGNLIHMLTHPVKTYSPTHSSHSFTLI